MFLDFTHSYVIAGLNAAQNGNILQSTAQSAAEALNTANGLWKELYNSSPIFGRVVTFVFPWAFLFFCWYGYTVIEEYAMQKHIQGWEIVKKMIIPLICIIMLSGSGGLAKKFTYGLRELTRDFGICLATPLSMLRPRNCG